MKRILITGGAGFIGYSLAKRLLGENRYQIVLVDNLNDYYDVKLKNDRLKDLGRINCHKLDIADSKQISELFQQAPIDIVVNLAAQAGVRYAKENPASYMHSNVDGFFTLIEAAAKYGVQKFLYASSSSVYGANTSMPFKESDFVGTPMSLYAATKLSSEVIASSYYFSYNLPVIGLRFFNVYGPWGRPDMAYYKWANSLMGGNEIELRNNGEMWRDMTYIDDVTKAISMLLESETLLSQPEVFNVGNQSPVKIGEVLDYLVERLGVKPNIRQVPKGEEEPVKTWADTAKLMGYIGFTPNTDFRYGLDQFLEWYKSYNS